MTAPTGEAVNYETTIAELTALAEQQRTHVDQCAAAAQAAEAMKNAIGDMQDSYRTSSAAAVNISDHLAAKNLDGVTLANAGTAVDAMPAGKVDEMFDQLEGMEAEARQRLADAEVALAATEANLQHIQATYGDAHATVAGNLGGDASFLDAGGGVTAAGPWAAGPSQATAGSGAAPPEQPTYIGDTEAGWARAGYHATERRPDGTGGRWERNDPNTAAE